ncbi:MAG: hypothetical protein AAGG56_17965 [Pseudomonadota bacterium]
MIYNLQSAWVKSYDEAPVVTGLRSDGELVQSAATPLDLTAVTPPSDATNFILRIEDVPGESESPPTETVTMTFSTIEWAYDEDMSSQLRDTTLEATVPQSSDASPPTTTISTNFEVIEVKYEEFDTQSLDDDTPYDASVPKEFRADLPPPPFEAQETTSDAFQFVETTSAGDADSFGPDAMDFALESDAPYVSGGEGNDILIGGDGTDVLRKDADGFVPDAMVLAPERESRDEDGLPDTIIWCIDGDGTSTGPAMINPLVDDFAWG